MALPYARVFASNVNWSEVANFVSNHPPSDVPAQAETLDIDYPGEPELSDSTRVLLVAPSLTARGIQRSLRRKGAEAIVSFWRGGFPRVRGTVFRDARAVAPAVLRQGG